MPKKSKRGQGEGSIRERFKTDKKTGKRISIGWEARYTSGVDKDGKQVQRSIYGKTSDEVKKKLRKVLISIDDGSYIEPTKTTVGEWLDTWMKDYKKQSVKPKTYSSYSDTIKLHIKPAIGSINLKDLQASNVQHMVTSIIDKGLSPRMAKYVHTVTSMAMKQAVKSNLILRNVCEAVTLPKQTKKEIRVLTKKEQDKFIKVVKSHRLGAAFILDLFTGLRIGELLALRWSDIDLNEGILKVNRNVQRIRVEGEKVKTKIIYGEPKTAAGKRSIPLLDDVVTMLKAHRTKQIEELKKLEWNDIQVKEQTTKGLVFINDVGNQIEIRNFERTFHILIDTAKIPNTNFHALRHTFATRGLENGIEPKVMQELLGHSSITMTMDIYSHVMPEKKKDSINKLKNLFKAAIN